MHYHKSLQLRFLVVFIYSVTLISTKGWAQHFTTIKSSEGVEILENGKKVLFYQNHPKSLNGKYERAGYVHPLYSLNEKVLTEDFPEDHLYHHGIFWTWHQIIVNDKKIADGWISENISWNPLKLKVKKNKKSVTLHTKMLWKSAPPNDKPVAIIRENTKITVHKSTSQYRVIDFDIQLFALVDNLKIGGSEDVKGYGGFCLRLKLPDDISFVSGDSVIIPQDTAVEAGHWMDFVGSFDGKTSPKIGVAVLSHPFDGDHRQKWILRKEKSMQNVVYPGRYPTELSKKGLRLRYRIVIHNSGIKVDKLNG